MSFGEGIGSDNLLVVSTEYAFTLIAMKIIKQNNSFNGNYNIGHTFYSEKY